LFEIERTEVGRRVLFITQRIWYLLRYWADWAMPGQRGYACLPQRIPSLQIKVCTDGVHNELNSALKRLKGKPHWLMIDLTAKAKGLVSVA
jgi:hypothetical protein